MTDMQTAEQPKVSPSGVPIVAGDPRFMTRDEQGRLVNPDGSVFVPEEKPRTVQDALADLENEINGVWHATPSGTESAVVRMRGHLKELRGFVDPNSPQAKADAAKKAEADRVALAQKQADVQKAQAAERDRVATEQARKDTEVRAEKDHTG